MREMTRAEAARILATVAAYDHRTASDVDAAAWAHALKELDPADCIAGVHAHYRGSTEWLMPAHVREQVRLIGNARAAAKERLELEASAGTRGMPDGFEDTFKRVPLEEPGSAFPHREALRRSCAYCGAQPGRPCTANKKDRRTPHPLRGHPEQESNPTGARV